MRYGSVCSGIEAASVAWEPLGWRSQFYSEIDAFPCALLNHYYNTPNFGDMNAFKEWPNASINVLVGGTPCQSFSVAGLRKGLVDPRGNLALTYLAIAARYRPQWILWENVPGVLSSAGGRDFAAFLGGLGELGYGWAYRVLDAQYFGVPQRRRRVFVVGYFGNWAGAAAVFFERESMRGDLAPRREAGKNIAAPLTVGAPSGSSQAGRRREDDVNLCVANPVPAHHFRADLDNDTVISHAITKRPGARQDPSGETYVTHSLRGEGSDASEDGTGRGTPLVAAFAQNSRDELTEKPVADSLKSGGGKPGQSYPAVRQGSLVRRLTPRECERLQGFPNDYTLVNFRGNPASDSARYKALGNSMAVPVMRWLGERIELVESVLTEMAA